MDWTQQAKQLFNLPKPGHFTNYRHCCECAEHDETLLAYDVEMCFEVEEVKPSTTGNV